MNAQLLNKQLGFKPREITALEVALNRLNASQPAPKEVAAKTASRIKGVYRHKIYNHWLVYVLDGKNKHFCGSTRDLDEAPRMQERKRRELNL